MHSQQERSYPSLESQFVNFASKMGFWRETGHCIHAQAGTESPRKEDVEFWQEVPPEEIQRMSFDKKSQVQTLPKKQELV